MSSSRVTRALASGKLVIVNREMVACGLEICNTDPDTGKVGRYVKVIQAGQTLDITRFASIKDIRKSKKLLNVITSRRIHVVDTWTKNV